MKNIRNICAVLLVSLSFYACDSDVTIDDPQNETIEEIHMKTGEEGNEGGDRPDGD